jgi:hypothetical protein
MGVTLKKGKSEGGVTRGAVQGARRDVEEVKKVRRGLEGW